MDELEISGKRYISTRRAAKEHHYHSDYIGQLIRAGKVRGTKVGRAWYVDEASLAQYLSEEDSTTLHSGGTHHQEEPQPAAEQAPVHSMPSRHVAGSTPEYQGYTHAAPKEEAEEDAFVPRLPTTFSGLRYITDDEPLITLVKKDGDQWNESDKVESSEVGVKAQNLNTKSHRILTAATFVIVGGAVFAAAIYVSTRLTTQVQVGSTDVQTAVVSNS